MNLDEIKKHTKTKYRKRDNSLISSNFVFNLDSSKAYSHGHWLFCTKLHGAVIFNKTRYSQSTSMHQVKAWQILNGKADIVLTRTLQPVSNLEQAFNEEIQGCKDEIKELIKECKSKGARKAKNRKRRIEIGQILKHMFFIRECKELLIF